MKQFAEWMQKSFEKPLFLYKHSTQCGSSRNAYVALHHFITRFPQLASHFLFAVEQVGEASDMMIHLSENGIHRLQRNADVIAQYSQP